jgi:hypothetical protein
VNGLLRLANWIVYAVVLTIVGFAVYAGVSGIAETRASSAPVAPAAKHTVTITSDPPGATVYLGNNTTSFYKTPLTLDLSEGPHIYRVAFRDYEDEFDLYKPYRGELNVTKDESVSVWLDRFTAEEVAEREAAAQVRAEAALAAAEAKADLERAYYRIETDCAYGANLTYMNADGNITQQSNMSNDWYYYFVPNPSQYLSVSAQNQCDYGSITVKIVHQGIAIEENTSTGAYVIASVSGTWD